MQRIVFASALVASVAASAIPEAERAQLTAAFQSWSAEFGSDPSLVPEGLDLNNMEAVLLRLRASKATIAELQSQNPGATFDFGPFALFSATEFADHVGKSFKHNAPKRILRGDSAKVNWDAVPSSSDDASFDWTTSKCLNPIKNQGNCGSCWAFASTGVSESAHCIATGELYDLSEQQVVSCEVDDGQMGCKGGWPADSIDWISKTGLCLTKDWPYTSGSTGKNGECKNNCAKKTLSIGSYVEIQGEASLQKAIETQPISVAVEAGNSVWQYYKGGVVTKCPGAQSDHAVIAVGFGTDSGKDFFKIRNSWGTKWGEQGYIRLQRGVGGKGMCNVAEYPSYPKIKGTPAPTTSKPAC